MFEDIKMDLLIEYKGICSFVVDNPFKRRALDQYVDEITEDIATYVHFEDDEARFIRDIIEDSDGEWHVETFSYERGVDVQLVAMRSIRTTDKCFDVGYVIYSGYPKMALENYIKGKTDVPVRD